MFLRLFKHITNHTNLDVSICSFLIKIHRPTNRLNVLLTKRRSNYTKLNEPLKLNLVHLGIKVINIAVINCRLAAPYFEMRPVLRSLMLKLQFAMYLECTTYETKLDYNKKNS